MREIHRLWHVLGLRQLYTASHACLTRGTATSHDEPSICLTASQFPSVFDYYVHKIQPPVRLIWTYWELDLDHRGTASVERIDLWSSIMRAKEWTEKDVTFWPVSVFDKQDEELKPDLSPLLEMVKAFNPSHLLCFGKAIHELFLAASLDSEYFRSLGCSLHQLPGAEEMLPDNRHAKRFAWNIIKQIHI